MTYESAAAVVARRPGLSSRMARPQLSGQPATLRTVEPGLRVIGIDPGSSTGLVCLQFAHALTPTWVEAVTLEKPGLTQRRPMTWDAELELHWLIRLFMERHNPGLVVLEEPWDISDGWGKGGRRVGTGFRVGAAWAFALTAIPPGVEIHCYPVRSRRQRRGTNEGWMRGKTWALRVAAQLAQVEGSPPWDDLSDHERCAFGVLMHHLGQAKAATP